MPHHPFKELRERMTLKQRRVADSIAQRLMNEVPEKRTGGGFGWKGQALEWRQLGGPRLIGRTALATTLRAEQALWSGADLPPFQWFQDLRDMPHRFIAIVLNEAIVTRSAYVFDKATGEVLAVSGRGVAASNGITFAGVRWLVVTGPALDWIEKQWSGRIIKGSGEVKTGQRTKSTWEPGLGQAELIPTKKRRAARPRRRAT